MVLSQNFTNDKENRCLICKFTAFIRLESRINFLVWKFRFIAAFLSEWHTIADDAYTDAYWAYLVDEIQDLDKLGLFSKDFVL